MEIPATLYHVSWIDQQCDPPFVEFRFVYRSREVLLAKGLIPPAHPLEFIQALTQAQPQTQSQGRKRKAKAESKPRKPAKKRNEDVPSSVAPKPPRTKKGDSKEHVKHEDVSPSQKVKPPKTSFERDLSTSPLVEYMERQRAVSHSVYPTLSAPRVVSPTDEGQFDILRELRELRVCVTSISLT